MKIIPQAVLKKIPLFPKVEVGIKDALQAQIRAGRQLSRLRVHAQNAIESGFVKSAAGRPGSVSEAPKILFTKILHPDQPLLRIVMVNFGNRHSSAIQKAGYVHIVAVFLFVAGVFDKYHRLVAESNAVELPLGSTFFKGSHRRVAVSGFWKAFVS